MQKFPKVMSCLCAVMVVASATEVRFDGCQFIGGHGYIETDISYGDTTVTINKILITPVKLSSNVINEITLVIPGNIQNWEPSHHMTAHNYGKHTLAERLHYVQTCIGKRAFQDLSLDNFKLKVIFEENSMYVQLPEDSSELFKGSTSITEIDFRGVAPNPTVTSTRGMFEFCRNLERINFGNLNTSNVTDMQWMFCQCEKLTSLNFCNFNTRNVAYMTGMFDWCKSLTNLDLRNFDTGKVQSMMFMFKNCTNLISLDLGSFDTRKVQNMEFMFKNCSNLIDLNLNNFDTQKVINMGGMFANCANLTDLVVSNRFDRQKLQNSKDALSGCNNLKMYKFK